MLIKIIKRVESGVDDNIALAKTLLSGSLNLVLLTLETSTSSIVELYSNPFNYCTIRHSPVTNSMSALFVKRQQYIRCSKAIGA
jgi:hypothetical protein